MSNPNIPPGPGRPKGSKNKFTKLQDQILAALEKSGGIQYFQKQSMAEPAAYLALIGKLLPKQMEVSGKDGGPVVVEVHDV
jgi:hypothetical protein